MSDSRKDGYEREELEKALKNADWAKHRGGKMPVLPHVKVVYKLRGWSQVYGPDQAGDLQWDHIGTGSDIMEFAVIGNQRVDKADRYEDLALLAKMADPTRKLPTLSDIKQSNPKDDAGSARIDLSLLDPIALAECALAMEEGRTKYGAYNYTVVGVKARTYVSATLRHLFKWLLGENRDPKTKVHHLGSAMACCMVLLCAESRGKLTDDRPPSNRDASEQLDSFEARVKHVRGIFKDAAPKHYTIKDEQHEQGTREQADSGGAQAPAEDRVPGEDAQRVPWRDPGRVVQRPKEGPLDRVEVGPSVAYRVETDPVTAAIEVAVRQKG